MLKRLWDFFLLTMGVTPKGAEPGPQEDRWAEARRRKDEEERAHEAREDEVEGQRQRGV